MRIAIQKQIQTPEQQATKEDGRILNIAQVAFETIAQAERFIYNAQLKYGPMKHKDYFSPEQGSASFSTEATRDGYRLITYHFYLDGFEGNLLNMISDKNAQASKRSISLRDKLADIDYSKSADRDALALENLAKKLHDYLSTGQINNNELNVYVSEIMDIANDLQDVTGRIGGGGGFAGLGAGASKKGVGLGKKADKVCPNCGVPGSLEKKDDKYVCKLNPCGWVGMDPEEK